MTRPKLPVFFLLLIIASTSLAQVDSAHYYLVRGANCYNESDYMCAERELKKSLVFANAGARSELSEIHTNLGNVYTAIGKIEEALQSYQEALRNIGEMKDGEAYKGKILTNIGALYEEQQDLGKALEYYSQSEAIARTSGDTLQLADVLNNKGLVLEQLDQLSQAQKLYEEALGYYHSLNNIERLTICYNSLGIVTKQQNKLDDAIIYYNKAVEYSAKLNNAYFEGALMNNLANVYALQKKFPLAIKTSMDALAKARSIDHRELIQECLGSISDHYSAAGDYKSAHLYMKQFMAANDSFISASRAEALAEMETKFGVERKELQIANLETQNKLHEEEDRRKKFFIGLLMAIIIIVVGGGILLARTKTLRQRKRELELVAATEKQERDRIAQDLHDELGSGISRINWITGSAQKEIQEEESKGKFAHIESIAHQLSSNMKSLIWLLYSGDVKWPVLLGRIREIIHQHAEDFGFHVKIDFAEGSSEMTIKQEAARNIFLIAKECITNISKHAAATEVICLVEQNEEKILMRFSDNGRGFDTENMRKGHGLYNLSKRTSECGGKMEIESKGSGSVFTFHFPRTRVLA